MDKHIDYFKQKLPVIEDYLSQIIDSLNPIIKPIAEHIVLAGGKRLRPFLCLLTAKALGYNKEEKNILPLACAFEIIHSATLLHDDIIDNANNRRGKKAAHLVFGQTETILAGDALLALANEIITSYKNVFLVSCVSKAIYKTALGEILEIQKMKKPFISKEEYFEIIKGKTAYLIQSCCESGAIIAGCEKRFEEAAKNFGLNIGIAFQLIDDALDYNHKADLGKPFGGDLKEGKITLPLILYLEKIEEDKRDYLLFKIKNNQLTEEEKNKIILEIQDKKIPEAVKEEAESYLRTAKAHLNIFPNSLEKELLLDVIGFIKERKK